MDLYELKKASLGNMELYLDKTPIPDMEDFILSKAFFHLSDDLKKAVLGNRQKRQNRQFVFSKENVKQILRVNERLRAVMESLRDEVFKIKDDQDAMIKSGKTYYNNYDIDGYIAMATDDDGNPLLAKLCEWATCPWHISLDEHMALENDDLLLEKLNWDVGLLAPLKDCGSRICYATHSILVDGSVLSLQDMVRIKDEDIYYGEEINL